MGESPPDIDDLGLAGLKTLVLELLEERGELRAENAALRAEIARMKGLKGKPRLKPSGMEPGSGRGEVKKRRKQKHRKAKRSAVPVTERQVLSLERPAGSRFKGYEDYVVQDVRLEARAIGYRRERWRTPDGRTLVAPLPSGIVGHFGPALRRLVLALYHQAQTTVERILGFLRALGVVISKRQVIRLLNAEPAGFVAEADDVLKAGLETARWVSVDDTGARHQGCNAVCTQIGNDHFAWFATTFSKSRCNFLELLQAGQRRYVINAAALAYMRTRGLARTALEALGRAGARHFEDQDRWRRWLEAQGVKAGKHPAVDPQRLATEGALWGAITETGALDDTVILSDDAGQFNLGHHALCWVHMERQIHKLDTFAEHQRQAKEPIRHRVWWLYQDLKAYKQDPTPRRRRELALRFERLFTTRTGFAALDRLLARILANKAELLVVLDRPDIPLHTNGSENDIRCQVIRRKISGSTRSEQGRESRDAMLSLLKTTQKLGLSFWDYLGHRLQVPDTPHIPPLPDLIRKAAHP